ncbi:hypothetical protein [Kluyvera ascorbata]|uniref:hypothetical protein n=1 Tax=Kluyvera ascorbata TaxID=51288 RepID=UPI001D1131A2|nr:hypothetical protein [Kluyvera ascorbata]MDU3913752.1 hypothetical protein [Kluyvera ascorbata]
MHLGAYILTRPFGAACGDLLSQPVDNGGVGLAITVMIIGLVVSDWRKRTAVR